MSSIFMIICYSLLAYGFANMIVYSSGPFRIFERLRNLAHNIHPQIGELFTCMMCLSTWLGLLFSVINIVFIPTIPFTPFNIILYDNSYKFLNVIFDMGLTSGVVWLLHQLDEMMERLGYYEEIEDNEEQ